MDRRRLLASLPAVAAVLAGCGGLPDTGPDPSRRTDRPTADTASPTRTVSLPYRGPSGENVADPAGVRVANDSGRERYVTVTVATPGGRDLLVASRRLRDEGVAAFEDVVARTGAYPVVVETADGDRIERTWRVGGGRGDLSVRLDRGLSALGTARCDPDCPPISQGGERSPPGADDRPGTVFLLNRREETATVQLRLADAAGEYLRYRYAVPPDVRVAVPAGGWGEPEHEVAVTVDDTTTVEPWRRADGDRLYAVVTDRGTRFLCDTHFRDLRVTNETSRSREVSVTVLADGTPTYEATVDVPAGGVRRRPNVVAPANRYGFDLATADGETARYRWGICPSRGAIGVVVREGGLWVGVRSMR